MSIPGTRVAALILAGGRGERLGGVIKSEIEVGGLRLLDRVAARLAGCSPLLVAHGHTDPALLRLVDGMIAIPDLVSDYAGPLAGLAGAMAYAAARPDPPEFIVTAAVDTPFLPEDYVERLLARIGSGDAAIAVCGGQPYPTSGIWRAARFLDLPARVVAGTSPRSLKSLAKGADAAEVEWPLTPAGDPFANINTPAELEQMQRRAALFP